MKIAYINTDRDAPVFGRSGCSVHMQEALLAMLNLGADVHLFATRLGEELIHNTEALTIHPLPRLVNKQGQSPLAINHTVRAALEKESEDGAFDLVYERFSLYSHAAIEFANARRIPSVLEVNAPLLEEANGRGGLEDAAGAEDAAMRSFRGATVITVISRQLGHIIEQHPSARGKVRVVPNAVNPARFVDVIATLPRDGFVIGFVGALRSTNGFNTLIESFTNVAQQIPTARLLIVGDGPVREHLNRELGARGLTERVHFTGQVAPDAVPGLLASMDVGVAPYPPLSMFYSSPLKIYEYMAAGLPIVASKIGQVAEIIDHEQTGLLFPPGDAPALTRALCELKADPENRKRLGDQARAAVQSHTWDHQALGLMSLAGLKPSLTVH
ncbi:MAG TPA: glycosyltransferase family 4 protein [Verrucomicrobiae bacterium]